jgi:hypothetical protein
MSIIPLQETEGFWKIQSLITPILQEIQNFPNLMKFGPL